MIEVTEETRAGWCIVAVRGRADAEAADALEAALRDAVQRHNRVAADLSALDYVSSAGLRALIQAAREAEGRRSEFAICSATPPVKKVFDMSGLQQILKIQGALPC